MSDYLRHKNSLGRLALQKEQTATAIKIKNRILAMPAAPAATPVKPKTPATREMMAKIMAHLSIGTPLSEAMFQA